MLLETSFEIASGTGVEPSSGTASKYVCSDTGKRVARPEGLEPPTLSATNPHDHPPIGTVFDQISNRIGGLAQGKTLPIFGFNAPSFRYPRIVSSADAMISGANNRKVKPRIVAALQMMSVTFTSASRPPA